MFLKHFLFSAQTTCSGIRLLIAFLCLPLFTFAQNHARLSVSEVSRKGTYYSRQSATILSPDLYLLEPGFQFTSLSLRIDAAQRFQGAYVVAGADTFLLQKDEHQPAEDTLQQANLIILDKPVRQILFFPGAIHGPLTFSFFNAATDRKGASAQRQQRPLPPPSAAPCDPPEVVSPAVWRAGLPEPDYRRIPTRVEHVVVHHAATSNTYTNYTNVVRNIYLFHTADRGWSDIGYNYLIAQDGTVFQGRSTGGQPVEPDNVQGAHFCGQNSGTMGVCLLGNYETAVPTEASLSSLVALTAWKLHRENLQPFNIIPHPANAMLGVIAGHRDGCATACPGDFLFARLHEVRLRVEERLQENCQSASVLAYPVPSSGMLHVSVPEGISHQQLLLYDLQGQRITVPMYEGKKDLWILDTGLLPEGVYILQVKGTGFQAEQKIILSGGS